MVLTFKVPEELAKKIVPKDTDPIMERKKEKELEEAQINDLRLLVAQILKNSAVRDACKDGALLIKKRYKSGVTPPEEKKYLAIRDLYLGYANTSPQGKIFCFFPSNEVDKDTDSIKPVALGLDSISNHWVDSVLKSPYNILADDLNRLVLSALTQKYTTATNGDLNDTLSQ